MAKGEMASYSNSLTSSAFFTPSVLCPVNSASEAAGAAAAAATVPEDKPNRVHQEQLEKKEDIVRIGKCLKRMPLRWMVMVLQWLPVPSNYVPKKRATSAELMAYLDPPVKVGV